MPAPAVNASMIARLVAVCVLPAAFLVVPAELVGSAPATETAAAETSTGSTIAQATEAAEAHAPGYGIAGCAKDGCETAYCSAPADSALDGYAVPCPRQG